MGGAEAQEQSSPQGPGIECSGNSLDPTPPSFRETSVGAALRVLQRISSDLEPQLHAGIRDTLGTLLLPHHGFPAPPLRAGTITGPRRHLGCGPVSERSLDFAPRHLTGLLESQPRPQLCFLTSQPKLPLCSQVFSQDLLGQLSSSS